MSVWLFAFLYIAAGVFTARRIAILETDSAFDDAVVVPLVLIWPIIAGVALFMLLGRLVMLGVKR